jgi:pentachlorophenol monooxygenase
MPAMPPARSTSGAWKRPPMLWWRAAHGQMDVYLVAAPDADVAGTVLPLIHDADGDFARNYDVSDTSVFAIRPDGYLAIAAGGVVDTDELVRHLKATFR